MIAIGPERTLIVGASALGARIVRDMEPRRHRLVGVVAEVAPTLDGAIRERVVGPLNRLAELIDELQPERLVIALDDRRGQLPMDALVQARVAGIAVEEAIAFSERLTGKIAIESLTPHDLVASGGFRRDGIDMTIAHVLGRAASAAALILLAPLLALIALAIKLDSPGPVWFVQPRAGLRGARLNLLKFRTMHPADHPTSEWACDNGHRITRVGAWLRRYRLDELPQLVNVVRGEMNLVGPRPHPLCNVALFAQKIPYYSLRTAVRPGLTGWAQVRQGYANGLEEETEKMRYDLYYIKHRSAWIDLRILLQTMRTVLAGDRSDAGHRAGAPSVVPVRPAPPIRLADTTRTLGGLPQ